MISKLHAISTPEGAKADVIFVHGLGGDPFSTWQHDSKEPEDSWPYWLKAAMPDVAVHALAYAASPHNWLGHSMPLGETAENVLGVLVASKGIGSRPVVLIGHSMGGLVIKQILRTVSDRKDVKPWQRIGDAVKAVVFLGTPHRGALLATYLERIGRYFETSFAVADLRRHGEVLIGLNDWYAANARDKGIETHCFYETEPTTSYGLPKNVMVVEKDSGDIDIADIPSYPVTADHIQICKPSDHGDFRVGYLMRVLEEVLPQASGEAGSGKLPIDLLPTIHGKFVGREADIKDIREALLTGDATVTAVEGMGGIGKTATGLQVARALREEGVFPDGVLFVDLLGFTENREQLSGVDSLASLLRQLLGSEAKLPDELGQLQQVWRQVTAGKRILLLLDNARDADQIVPLLPGHKDCRVLTTSRNRFTLPGLKPIELGLLTEEEAIELALARGNQRWPDRLSREQAERLAACCGRHPLAIEVTASALGAARSLNVDEQLEKLKKTEKDALNMEEVKAVLWLSIDLLELDQRVAWRRLGVFEGDFNAEAANVVMDVENIDDTLAALETRSLVTWQPGNRLQFHDILRAMALEDLGPAEREVAGERHSQHYKGVLTNAHKLYLSGEVAKGLELYDIEQQEIHAGQLRAALKISSSVEAARLAADYAAGKGHLLALRLTPRERMIWLEAQERACRKLGDQRGLCNALSNLGGVYRMLGMPMRGLASNREAVKIARESKRPGSLRHALGNLGGAYLGLGEPRLAIQCFEEAKENAEKIGDRRGKSQCLGGLGEAYRRLGEFERALQLHNQRLVIAKEIGDRRSESIALWHLARVYENLGKTEHAFELVRQYLDIACELGDRWHQGNAWLNGARILNRLNDWPTAERWLEEASSIFGTVDKVKMEEVRSMSADWIPMPDVERSQDGDL